MQSTIEVPLVQSAIHLNTAAFSSLFYKSVRQKAGSPSQNRVHRGNQCLTAGAAGTVPEARRTPSPRFTHGHVTSQRSRYTPGAQSLQSSLESLRAGLDEAKLSVRCAGSAD